MLEKVKEITAAIVTKIAVQMAFAESALNAIEILSIAEPEMKVKTDSKHQYPIRQIGKPGHLHRERATPKNSRPIRPNSISPTSSIP